MPKYQVTKTESVEVWADDEKHAEEVANGEMHENPNATYEVERLTPEMISSMEEVADMLSRMGYLTSVESQAWRGMPSWLAIGDTHHNTARFALYYNLNETGSEISGTGYYLSLADDESQIVAEIGNHTAPRIVGEILYNMGRADFDMEARR